MCCQPRRLFRGSLCRLLGKLFWARPPARMMWWAPLMPLATKIGWLIRAFPRCSVPCPAIVLATFDLEVIVFEDSVFEDSVFENSDWETPDAGWALATNIAAAFDSAGLDVEAAPEATVSTTLVEV